MHRRQPNESAPPSIECHSSLYSRQSPLSLAAEAWSVRSLRAANSPAMTPSRCGLRWQCSHWGCWPALSHASSRRRVSLKATWLAPPRLHSPDWSSPQWSASVSCFQPIVTRWSTAWSVRATTSPLGHWANRSANNPIAIDWVLLGWQPGAQLQPGSNLRCLVAGSAAPRPPSESGRLCADSFLRLSQLALRSPGSLRR